MPTGVDIAIENLKTELNQVRMDLSEKRKAGYDTKIAELELGNVASKIQMAEATKQRHDIQYASEIIARVKNELETATKKDEGFSLEKVKQEEEEKQKEGEIMARVRLLINEAHAALRKNDKITAFEYYKDLREIYKSVPKKMKRLVYHRTVQIHEAISKGE